MNTRENIIHKEINALNTGEFASQNSVAGAYGLPRSTLQQTIKGRKNARQSHTHQQHLAPEQEKLLVEWILEENRCGYPPLQLKSTRNVLRKFLDHNPSAA